MVVTEMSPAHLAVENSDTSLLVQTIKSGGDVHEEYGGLPLLHHAIDVEIDAHLQTGAPLHVDLTAALLALGADPHRGSHGGTGVTAEHMASARGHWLAQLLIQNLRSGN